MMLNFIDALGTFENSVGQLVVIGGIAALAAIRCAVIPARSGRPMDHDLGADESDESLVRRTSGSRQ
jgi:hypothetical protein